MTYDQKRLLLLSSLGGVLELYDFVIYALMANYISINFFPSDNNVTSLIGTFATFAIGYLARPLGGVLFGHFGDRFGRKQTFAFSILMMALATLGIALIPTYASIGIAAPIILTLLRICQGLSVGGEIPGAIAYVSESMPNIKGLACGLIFFAVINGIVLASLIQAILTSTLSTPQMLTWGWRLPFLLGGLFGFFSYLLRRQLQESALFKAIAHQTEVFPLAKVFQQEYRHAFAGLFVVGLGAVISTLFFLFIPLYLKKILHINSPSYIWYNTLAIFISTLLVIFFGLMSDKYSRKTLLLWASILSIITAYPIFNIYVTDFSDFAIALGLTAITMGFVWGVMPSLLAELFPTPIRYSGIAVSYNLGFALFGGLTPLIVTLLIKALDNPLAPIYYLIATATLALIALLFIQQKNMAEA